MQQSSAAKKLDLTFENIQKAVDKKQNSKKQTGDLFSQPQVTQQLPPMITRVVEERIIHISRPQISEEIDDSKYQPQSVSSINALGYQKNQSAALVPTITSDILRNFVTYFMVLSLTALAVFKVYQVQMTRELTAQYNEVNQHNELLEKEWHSLLSEKATLTEYSVVRKSAEKNLSMVSPKTEDEIVINL